MERQKRTRSLISSEEEFPLFSNLPDEMAMEIFRHLDVISQIRLRRVCKKWDFLLRRSSNFRTVYVNEWDFCKIQIAREKRKNDPTPNDGYYVWKQLAKNNVWKHVECVVFDGCYYNISREDSREGVRGSIILWALLSAVWKTTSTKEIGDFPKLKAILARNAALDLAVFHSYAETSALKMRLVVSSGSIFFEDFDAQTYEFPINDSVTFDCAGEMGALKSDNDLHVTKDWTVEMTVKSFRMPMEIAEFIVKQCENVPADTVARLGEAYSVLLKGRPGMRISNKLVDLFHRIFEDDELEDNGDEPYWARCKDYDFSGLDKLTKYALVYYSNPSNCYRVSTDEEEEILEL